MYKLRAFFLIPFLLKMLGKGFYSKRVKSSFEQFITKQTRVTCG